MDHDDPLLRAEDPTLVVRAADGDVRSFEVLARRHGPVMRVYAEQMLGSNVESDDVVQESFLTGGVDSPTSTTPRGSVRG